MWEYLCRKHSSPCKTSCFYIIGHVKLILRYWWSTWRFTLNTRLSNFRRSVNQRIRIFSWTANSNAECREIWLMAISLHQFYLDKKPARKVSVIILVLFLDVFVVCMSSARWHGVVCVSSACLHCVCYINPYLRLDFIL